MSMLGVTGLVIAAVFAAGSFGCLGVGHFLSHKHPSHAKKLALAGTLCMIGTALGLTMSVVALGNAFLTGDVSLDYVVNNRTVGEGPFGWLYCLSGIWAGRAGSLLVWAWLMSVFAVILLAILALGKRLSNLDNGAFALVQLFIFIFVLILLISENNNPFIPLDIKYSDGQGGLIPTASVLGMSMLLQHWAMALHPVAYLVAYAGFVFLFAYAVAALVTGDSSPKWISRATPWVLLSNLFVAIGLLFGAYWSYTTVGWGGCWGWDPTENMGLIPLILGLLTIHVFNLYRTKQIFKRWSVMAACITFSSVMLSAFVARSGEVPSIHSFGEDALSGVVFPWLALAVVLVGAAGVIWRWKKFAPKPLALRVNIESVMAWVNALLFLCAALVLAYLSLVPILPAGLPLTGTALSTSVYESIGLVFAIFYAFLIVGNAIFRAFAGSSRFTKQRLGASQVAALVCHCSLLLLFVGLICSTYFASSGSGVVPLDKAQEEEPSLVVDGFSFVYVGNETIDNEDTGIVTQRVYFDVYGNGFWDGSQRVGVVDPAIKVQALSEKRKAEPAVLARPLQDIVVAYRGQEGNALSLDVSVYPFMWLVWLSSSLFIIGLVIGLFAPRKSAVAHGRKPSELSLQKNSREILEKTPQVMPEKVEAITPEKKPEPKPEPKTTPAPEPQPTPVSKPESKPEAKMEAKSEPLPISAAKPEPKPEPKSEPARKLEPQPAAAKPQSKPTLVPEPQTKSEPTHASEPTSVPKAASTAKTAPTATTTPTPTTTAVPKPAHERIRTEQRNDLPKEATIEDEIMVKPPVEVTDNFAEPEGLVVAQEPTVGELLDEAVSAFWTRQPGVLFGERPDNATRSLSKKKKRQ